MTRRSGRGWPAPWWPLLLFLAALGFRLTYQAQMRASPLWEHPVLDEAYNDAWAVRVAAGQEPPDLPFFRAPLYPATMALAYRLLGHRPEAVRISQAILSSASCLILFYIGRALFGAAAGWVAGAAAALYWPWVYFDGELQDVPLTLFLNLAGLALLVAPGRAGPWRALGAGLCLGLSAVTRPTVLITVPAVLAWLLWRAGGESGRRRLLPAAALVVGLTLPIAPVTAVNLLAGGDTVLIASQGGLNFYIGNNPQSDGHSARLPGASAEWAAMVQESRRRAEAAAGRALRPSEVSRHWFGEAWRFWRRQPGAALRLTARKVGYLLGAPELPNNKQILFFTTTYAPLMRLPWPGFGVVAPLALVGVLWGGGGPRARLLLWFALAYGAGVVAFFVAARFRMPFAAVLIIFAGGGAAALWRLARSEGVRRLALPLSVLAVAAAGVNLPRLGHRENLAHAHYTLANAHRAAGQRQAAIDEYRRALAEDARFREARRDLGAELLAAGRPRQAVELLRPALAREPGDSELRVNLALALRRLGEADAALAELQTAVSMDPTLLDAWIKLGNAYQEQGRSEEAAAAFLRALRLDDGDPVARYNLANVRLAQGRDAEAVDLYRRLVERQPDHGGAWNNLGIALARLGRPAEAEAAFRRGLALRPDDASLRLNLAGALAASGRTAEARRELQRVLRDAAPGGEVERRARQALEQAGER